jgi:hypothetical protein
MDTKLYHLRADITLTPVWHSQAPNIIISLGDVIIYAGGLYKTTTFYVDQLLPPQQYDLTIEFTNKTNEDTQDGLDKAVIIEQLTFNDISNRKFIWEGVYKPVYPEPWASEQTHLEPLLKNYDYLGWNGKWTLTFDVPVFTWIHKTQNLGWIYD